ncbi:uncharacterized protein LOC131884486 isoform X2 [Tigriopus californicus]|uniref:uncharacterized protein LOC131884486 isoform X2 n=1 Tax=Tigriopus californicus TaxID=6832 RepID=UPI0027DA60A0|nr:uncharacterized protein LOC131884486 isoform X2 [Tigriopus californicus]
MVDHNAEKRLSKVKALETAMAQLLGHEASLFVPSGTMANLLAVMTHCQKRGSEVLLGHKSHMFRWSQGNIAQIAGVHSNALTNMPDGTFCLNELQTRIQADDEHCPITSLICIENTHCDTGGTILNLPWLRELRAMSTKYNIPVHVDGARLLNAAVGLKIPPSELVRGFESVQVCLSKGVGAPFGSILAGTKRFVTQARRYRKAIGGGVRQNGFMARAGLCALEDWEMKLQRDHEHAKLIAQGVESIGSGQVRLLTESVDSNIVLLRTKCVSPEKIVSRLKRITPDEGESLEGSIAVRCAPLEKDVIRLVTSCNQSTEDIKLAVKKLQFVIMELLKM